ncbi:radical SAM additional 4Fe4S-binding SPASM domain-containing protein [Ruminococcaceae bacterium YRB3002]|nr:radical SAM additional 4Fe4S-binding SPASM domain-containing protein [Ruminococcaceae bacterium YRB3002]
MNLTLHLTERCNMDCSYCLRVKRPCDMPEEVLYKALELAFSKGQNAGVCFFGGEPMLKKDLILKALDRAKTMSDSSGKPFACKMTSNGTLLDEDFLKRAKEAGMVIGLSYDALGQDISRRFADKDHSSTSAVLREKAELLLKYLPDSVALITVAPQAVPYYAESVKHVHDLGFKQASCVLAYGSRVNWTDGDMEILRGELDKTVDYMTELFRKSDRFKVTPLCSKITECIKGVNPASRCHLGVRQMQVDVRGDLYPCTSFVGDPDYLMGNVFDGVDESRVSALAAKSNMPETCRNCELNKRCTNSCGCSNRMNTGDENKISPLQCTYERMLIDAADRLGNILFTIDQARFAKYFG